MFYYLYFTCLILSLYISLFSQSHTYPGNSECTWVDVIWKCTRFWLSVLFFPSMHYEIWRKRLNCIRYSTGSKLTWFRTTDHNSEQVQRPRLESVTVVTIIWLIISRSSHVVRSARSCATAYLLTDAQHTSRAGIVRDDQELLHQIITCTTTANWVSWQIPLKTSSVLCQVLCVLHSVFALKCICHCPNPFYKNSNIETWLFMPTEDLLLKMVIGYTSRKKPMFR